MSSLGIFLEKEENKTKKSKIYKSRGVNQTKRLTYGIYWITINIIANRKEINVMECSSENLHHVGNVQTECETNKTISNQQSLSGALDETIKKLPSINRNRIESCLPKSTQAKKIRNGEHIFSNKLLSSTCSPVREEPDEEEENFDVSLDDLIQEHDKSIANDKQESLQRRQSYASQQRKVWFFYFGIDFSHR